MSNSYLAIDAPCGSEVLILNDTPRNVVTPYKSILPHVLVSQTTEPLQILGH